MGNLEGLTAGKKTVAYHTFLKNPKTTGGSIKDVRAGVDSVAYSLGKHEFEVYFRDSDDSDVHSMGTVKRKGNVRTLYIHPNEIDWHAFFISACQVGRNGSANSK